MPSIQALAGAIDDKIEQKLTALNNTTTNDGQKRKRVSINFYPCPACGSTKQNPIGNEHHYPRQCPKWDFALGLNDDDDAIVAKCIAKEGNADTEPWYKQQQKQGNTMYWQQSDFKNTNSYEWLLNNKKTTGGAKTVVFSEQSNKKAKVTNEQNNEQKATMTSDWEEVFGKCYAT